MDTPVKLLVVEDNLIIAANIALQLSELGYEVTRFLCGTAKRSSKFSSPIF
ncbi:hypothetical protein [Spirosoma sp. KCTC 42546]|uniref:hypothetical protein n=1 Tax=Spirosoma sp. KCTC 42546 TaxID=2520506 RepID=UPI00352FD4F1